MIGFPEAATHVHKIPGLKSSSLISVSRLCDEHHVVTFTKTACIIFYQNELILDCKQNKNNAPLPMSN